MTFFNMSFSAQDPVQTEREIDKQTVRQTDRQTDRLTDRQTDRQPNGQTDVSHLLLKLMYTVCKTSLYLENV